MTAKSFDIAAETAPSEQTVDPNAFFSLMEQRTREFLALVCHIGRPSPRTDLLTRPYLGLLLSEAAQLEELLDAYGARNNIRWCPFRHLVAGVKAYSRVSYTLLHIRHTSPSYRLLQIEGDFRQETLEALAFCAEVLHTYGARIMDQATRLKLNLPEEMGEHGLFDEEILPGRLPHDRTIRTDTSAEETVAHLATSFLNLAAESDVLHIHKRVPEEEYRNCIPEPVNEEEIRLLEFKFHNLQSLYDTFVADTNTEETDPNLPILRGHISVIFHLLEAGVIFTHHYERHVMAASGETQALLRPAADPDRLLRILFEYCLVFSSRYLVSARSLCQAMLRRYARTGTIHVPVPRYRGFHVRPSTLVSKIVHHYGSEVFMQFGGEMYDASAPLDLFRANEMLNAGKRRRVALAIDKLDLPEETALGPEEMVRELGKILLRLAADNKVVIYERPLPLDEFEPAEGCTLRDFILTAIHRLLAMGKIDIECDAEVTFHGDERVLEDIRVLAESGYGEDAFGHNIPLPKSLGYLRR